MKSFDLFRLANPTARGPERRKAKTSNFKGLERRAGPERRGLNYGLTFKTSAALAPLEEWLAENFPGQHRFTIEDMSEDLLVKHVRVLFTDDADRQDFREYLRDYLKNYR